MPPPPKDLPTHALAHWVGQAGLGCCRLSPKLAPVCRHFIRLHAEPLVSGQVRAGRPTDLFPALPTTPPALRLFPGRLAPQVGSQGPGGPGCCTFSCGIEPLPRLPPPPTASLTTKTRGPAPQPAAAACLRVCRGPLAERPGSGSFSVWPLRGP